MHTWNWAVPRYCCRNWHRRRQCFFPDHSLWEDAESCLKQQQKLTLESFPSKPFGLQFWIQCFGFPKLNAGTTQEVLLWSCLDKSGEVWSLINLYATQHQGTRPDSAQAGRQYFIQRSDKNSELAGVLLPLGKKTSPWVGGGRGRIRLEILSAAVVAHLPTVLVPSAAPTCSLHPIKADQCQI